MWKTSNNKLQLITVSIQYTDYLRSHIDSKIPNEHTENHRLKRPFVGILISEENHKYVIPITSPKPKHLQMKNTIDFHKIDEGKYGAINFNNMFPIIDHPSIYTIIDTSSLNNHSVNDQKYILLLRNQLTWLNKKDNKQIIINKAQKLRNAYYMNNLPIHIKKRCCNFIELELHYKDFLVKSI